MTRSKPMILSALGLALAACGEAPPTETYDAARQALETAGEDLRGTGPCATVEQIDEDCPTDIEWESHGQYVSCVARYLAARRAAGHVSAQDVAALVEIASSGRASLPDDVGGDDTDAGVGTPGGPSSGAAPDGAGSIPVDPSGGGTPDLPEQVGTAPRGGDAVPERPPVPKQASSDRVPSVAGEPRPDFADKRGPDFVAHFGGLCPE